MLKEQKVAFFSRSKREPTIAKVGGKFSFSKLSQEVKKNIFNRLAEKDEVMAKGLKGEIPGILIDGKVVTKDNIHEFELEPLSEKEKKLAEEVWEKGDESEVEEELYKKSDLEKLSMKELKVIGKKFGTTDRSKVNLIKEILKLQK